MNRLLPLLALLTLLALTASPAAAQDVWGWSVIIPSVTGTDQLGLHLRDQMQRSRSVAAPAPQPQATAEALSFTPSPERRAANFARFVEARRGRDPAGARQLEQLLSDPQLMAKIDRELKLRGLRADNLADAYTVWWIQAWQALHGQTADPSPPAVRAVKAQVERALLASPTLLAADDAQKQEFTEGLLIQAVIAGAALEQVKADPAQLRALGQVVRGGARQMGLDLDALTLTDQGFMAAGG